MFFKFLSACIVGRLRKTVYLILAISLFPISFSLFLIEQSIKYEDELRGRIFLIALNYE